jgi:hypothetical protein
MTVMSMKAIDEPRIVAISVNRLEVLTG